MDVGALRHLVTLENPGTPIPDGVGGYTETWVPLFDTWASIVPATARDLERVVAGTVLSTATHVVTIRYQPNVSTQTRVRFGTRTFSVTGVQNTEERSVQLMLICVEIV